jgi:hypothetical protein
MRGDETSIELSAPVAHLLHLAQEELGHMSVRCRAEGLARTLARRSTHPPRKRLFLGLAAVLTALSLGVLAARWFDFQQVGTLSYTVDSGQVGPGGVIEGNGTTEPRLRFSDGTEVVFRAGSRGQVRSIDGHGARIAVAGKAKVEVVPWRGSHWLFDVGPFLITVKGTAFTAEWSETEERLEIVLKTGTVAVSGPTSDEAITLRAGQRLVISMRDKEVVIRDIDAAGSSIDATSVPSPHSTPDVDGRENVHVEVPSHEAPARGAAAPSSRARSKTASRASNWTAELASGHFAAILREAEQRGLARSIEDASSDDLAALADAARYSRRDDIARSALTAQRRRFAATARASDAAFLLGRLEEAAQHLELALGWYERCLREGPRGTYTSEALGRRMTVVERLYGASRARPIAEEYLRRFENGTYAAAARALTRPP